MSEIVSHEDWMIAGFQVTSGRSGLLAIVGLLFENLCPEFLGGIVFWKWNVRNRLTQEPT